MRKQPDPAALDAAALAQHRDFRNARPRSRRAPRGPDLSRRNAFQCRVHDLIQAQVEEERERGAYSPADEIEPSAARVGGGSW